MKQLIIVHMLTLFVFINANDKDVDRQLQKVPDDVSICDEYFFGRQASVPASKAPFCVNGGYCKASWIRDTDHPCECLKGYEGPHCEFEFGMLPPSCDLGCQNGSVCKIGAPSWQHYYQGVTESGYVNPLDLQHCFCPVGYTGLLCEVKATPCGDSYCHHSAKCVQIAEPDGSIHSFCDCTTADSGPDGETSYAGQYCEHEATSYCSRDHNGQQFCVNGGECKAESHMGCNCKEGFVGPLCEFEDRGSQQPIECNLKCNNHGICRKGAKDVSALEKFGIFHNRHLAVAYNEDFEHCVCPRGYVGLQCEYQLDLCPGGAHACLNGGDCVTVPESGTVSYACDCTGAETQSSRFAGEYCEMESTQFCTEDGGKTHEGPGLSSFCTNGGQCRAFVSYFDEHPGCDCPEGFEGENCQYHIVKDRSINMGMVAAGSIVSGTILFVCLLFLIRRRRRRVAYKNLPYPQPPTLDLIAQSLGTDARTAEYIERSSRSARTTAVVPHPGHYAAATSNHVHGDALVYMKKSGWPQQLRNSTARNPIRVYDAVDISAVEEEDEVRSSRKKHWPNDAKNDASNPIHVFDDISLNSEDQRMATSTTSDDNNRMITSSDESSGDEASSDDGTSDDDSKEENREIV